MDGATGECVLEDTSGDNWWDDIVNTILAPFKALIELVEGIFSFIKGLFDWLVDLVKALFVPNENFWDNQSASFTNILENKLGTKGLENIFSQLENVQQSQIPNFDLTLNGNTFTIIDMKFLSQYQGMIHTLAYAIFGILLVKYNINNVYKVVRGGSLYDS